MLHALGYFAHEYAHSFTAWLLGWKANPLALNYGHLDTANLFIQSDVDENVDYGPIFAAHCGAQAALIAVAGVAIGNALVTYAAGRAGFLASKKSNSRGWGMFFYWLCVASAGNMIAYVPNRTFAGHADMYTVVKGLSCSPWLIIIVLGFPFSVALFHFILRFAPNALTWFFPASPGKRVAMVVLTSVAIFGFYGSAGLSGYGPVSHVLATICLTTLLPLSMAFGFWRTFRPKQTRDTY